MPMRLNKAIRHRAGILFLTSALLLGSGFYGYAALRPPLRSGYCPACLPLQQPARDVAREPARPSREWVRDGVIYEIYPRAFSPQGNFNGITARLDNLKDLGVTILWLMPIHPIGREKKKGSI